MNKTLEGNAMLRVAAAGLDVSRQRVADALDATEKALIDFQATHDSSELSDLFANVRTETAHLLALLSLLNAESLGAF